MMVDGQEPHEQQMVDGQQEPPSPEADDLTEIESSLLRYVKSMTLAVGKVFAGQDEIN